MTLVYQMSHSDGKQSIYGIIIARSVYDTKCEIRK